MVNAFKVSYRGEMWRITAPDTWEELIDALHKRVNLEAAVEVWFRLDNGIEIKDRDDYEQLLKHTRDQHKVRVELVVSQQEMETKENTVVHFGVMCDTCHWEDIQGIRYRCFVCEEYNLCESCESKHSHIHPLIKITSPDMWVGKPWEVRSDIVKPSISRQMNFPVTELNSEPKKMNAQFVSFSSSGLKSGSIVQTNEVFQMGWVVRNNGDNDWEEGCYMAMDCGEFPECIDVIYVHPLKVGEESHVLGNFYSGPCDDTIQYKSFWRLRGRDGTPFGQRLKLDVVVVHEDMPWMQRQIRRVESMGFSDRRAIEHALEVHDGDVAETVCRLIRSNKLNE